MSIDAYPAKHLMKHGFFACATVTAIAQNPSFTLALDG
jgi:hypothetical protein